MTQRASTRPSAITLAAFAGLLCAGCSSSPSKTSSPSEAGGPSVSSISTGATSGSVAKGAADQSSAATLTPPLNPGSAVSGGGPAKVRVVNLYAPADHPQGAVLDGFTEGQLIAANAPGTGTPTFGSFAYGTVSDYLGVDPSKVGDVAFFVHGQPGQIASANIDGSVASRYTLIMYANDQGSASFGAFNETPTETDVAQNFPGSLSAPPDGQALIVADGGPLQYIKSRDSYNLGEPGKGCFALQVPDGPNDGQTNIPSGGSLNYVADPGTHQIAYFNSVDSTCSQAPAIGPVAVTLAAGDRTYVVGYGTGPSSLKLMNIPVATFKGDPALVPGPTTSTAAPVSAVDPCSVITTDQAAGALGAPVDGSTPDTGQGTCTFTAGVVTLTIAIQSGMTKAGFDLLTQSPTAQPIAGIGDQAVLTSNPVSIIVLKGTTMFAVVLDHHTDSGSDDPSVDNPLIEQIAKDAAAAL